MSALTITSKDEADKLVEIHRVNGWSTLPPDKSAFAYAWIESFSHIEAARAIGKAGQGLRYMRDPETRAFIAELKAAYEDRRIITEGFVADLLLDMIPKLTGEEEIDYIDRGLAGKGKKFDGPTLARVADLCCKLAGVADKKEMTFRGGPPLQMNINIGGPEASNDNETVINPALDPDDFIEEQNEYE